MRYNDTPDDKELIEDLKSIGVDYVVMDQLGYASTPRYLIPAVDNNSDRFEVVLRDQTTNSYLLRLVPD